MGIVKNQIGLTTHELWLLPQPMFWRMEAAVKAIQMIRDDWFGFFALWSYLASLSVVINGCPWRAATAQWEMYKYEIYLNGSFLYNYSGDFSPYFFSHVSLGAHGKP